MNYKHILPSLEEVIQARKPLRNANREHQESLTWSERFAVFIHRKVGSLGFFLLLITWTAAWLGWNIFGPLDMRFDPAPAFVIWLFASNIIQLSLLPVIMLGQNVEGRAAEKRSQNDFEINERAEEEIKVIIGHLENQNELLLEALKKIERS
ncbi:DUF1003 domain-containing protein [Candidatus Parcubacteria bacterium]|nr:DUF1003 domain-containing protein [Candidatus Parcubacteria bacterium]